MSNPRETIVVHRHDPRNIGDMSCAPSGYAASFPWLEGILTIDIYTQIDEYADRLAAANVIYGGGGLLGTGFFDPMLERLMNLEPQKLVVWSAGHNNHNSATIKLPDYMRRFDLVGVRDFGTPNQWVPCVSAMIECLEDMPDPEHEVVIFRHWDDDFAGLLNDTQDIPTLRNNGIDLTETLKFLASGKTVVTNSYHGAYWATLMGRKVVIVSPFSSKFFGFKWPIPIVEVGDWRGALTQAQIFPGALEECRQLNIAYGERVRRLFA